jgi:phosphatidylglycerophosphate synthase
MAALRRGGYGYAAWRTFFRTAGARVREQHRVMGGVRRSLYGWLVLALGLGLGVLGAVHGVAGAPRLGLSLTLFLPWFSCVCGVLLLHVGLVRREDGTPFTSYLVPNGLSALRLALAPLVAWPVLSLPPGTAVSYAIGFGFLGVLACTDLADGYIARRFDLRTELGRMLDPFADIVLLAALAVGLYGQGFLPGYLLGLVLLRYPGTFLGALVLLFLRGPSRITATLIGKVTTFVVTAALSLGAALALAGGPPRAFLLSGAANGLHLGLAGLIGINVSYLVYRALTWRGQSE